MTRPCKFMANGICEMPAHCDCEGCQAGTRRIYETGIEDAAAAVEELARTSPNTPEGIAGRYTCENCVKAIRQVLREPEYAAALRARTAEEERIVGPFDTAEELFGTMLDRDKWYNEGMQAAAEMIDAEHDSFSTDGAKGIQHVLRRLAGRIRSAATGKPKC